MSKNLNLSTDQPLSNPKFDKLGYSKFAQNLSESILNMNPENGLVISLNGPWGSGKSTILNFINFHISKENREDLIVFPFNPWWFSSEEDLVTQFLIQLTSKLPGRKFKKLKKHLGNLARILSIVPGNPASKLTGAASDYLKKPKDIYQLKNEIEKTLVKQNLRFLIIIDDIDRLSTQQMKQMFQTVKSVANFSNIIYLLSFDKEVVTNSLSYQSNISGEEYLEKIIQVQFDLPLPTKESLRRIFSSRLSTILESSSDKTHIFSEEYWTKVFFNGIENFLNTPRKIIQLTNAFSLSYPSVKGEVNFIDFFALETLRLFSPLSYKMVMNNPDEFCGDHTNKSGFLTGDEGFHLKWSEDLPEDIRSNSMKLLGLIFPKVNRESYSEDTKSSWRRERMIRSKIAFPVYFHLQIPENDFSNYEISSFLESTSDQNKFEELLLNLTKQHFPNGYSKARVLLERLEDYTNNDIALNHIPNVYRAFYNIGHRFIIESDSDFDFLSGFSNQMLISRILYQLGVRLKPKERSSLIKECLENGQSLETITFELSLLIEELKETKSTDLISDSEKQVSLQDLSYFKTIALDRIHQAIRSNTLIEKKELSFILYRWEEWSENLQSIKSWVSSVITDKNGIISLISAFILTRRAQGLSNGKLVKNKTFDFKNLSSFCELKVLFEKILEIRSDNDLINNQKEILDKFISEYKIYDSRK